MARWHGVLNKIRRKWYFLMKLMRLSGITGELMCGGKWTNFIDLNVLDWEVEQLSVSCFEGVLPTVVLGLLHQHSHRCLRKLNINRTWSQIKQKQTKHNKNTQHPFMTYTCIIKIIMLTYGIQHNELSTCGITKFLIIIIHDTMNRRQQ